MFIGHYGASFAAKRFAPKLSLGTYFVAAQLLDVAFSILVIAGIEKLRIVPHFTEVNAYDCYFMPYTHSLVGALVGALIAGAAVFMLFRESRSAVAFGLVVFSHFVLDVPVHTPDLPLLGNDSTKIGLGLWRNWEASVALELIVFGIGAALYWKSRMSLENGRRKTELVAFLIALVLLTLATPFLPPPASSTSFALQALFGYALLAFLAYRVDREPRSAL